MSRNANSHFSSLPQANINRSVFDRSHNHSTTFNFGQVIPIEVADVLPGDTVSITTSKVLRLSTPLAPVIGNAYADIYWFFVPERIVWDHAKNFYGESDESPYTPATEYTKPQVTSPASTGWAVGTIADHMMFPVNMPGLTMDALPFRAYADIINHWFRAELVQDPINFATDDTDIAGSNGDTFVTDIVKGGMPFIAAKFHDYFTSALPTPSGPADVQLPLGSAAPVFAGDVNSAYDFPKDSGRYIPLKYQVDFVSPSSDAPVTEDFHSLIAAFNGSPRLGKASVDTSVLSPSEAYGLYPINLYSDLTQATGSTISQLRQAFSLQKFYELENRSGNRYGELIKAHFGVTSPDSRLNDPEYLGGNRCPIKFQQVAQTSGGITIPDPESKNAGGSDTPLGHTGAYSLTVDVHSDFTRSFTEHGWLIGLCVCRYSHSYTQGIPRMYSRKDRYDVYWPMFNGLSDQEIYNKELYADGSSTDDEIFGYQERYSEYRYSPNYATGLMRPGVTGSLAVWNYADDYASCPSLSPSWLQEDKSNVDRTLSVTSAVSDQVLADFYFKETWTRPMPAYSIPGIDRM